LVTTTLVFQLIEQKKLTLQTKVKDVLEDFFSTETTIEQLLTHQSGLRPVMSNSDKLLTKNDVVKQIFAERFVYEPNQRIVYSDTGFMILGLIIEKICQESISEVAKKNIFIPLKMDDTTYQPNAYRSVMTECAFTHSIVNAHKKITNLYFLVYNLFIKCYNY